MFRKYDLLHSDNMTYEEILNFYFVYIHRDLLHRLDTKTRHIGLTYRTEQNKSWTLYIIHVERLCFQL